MTSYSFLNYVQECIDADMPLENSDELFELIAETVLKENVACISWTEGKYTRYDLLFSIPRRQLGRLGRGARVGGSHLFVSILSHVGGRPFLMDSETLYPSKVAENLGFPHDFEGEELIKLTELINGVKTKIKQLRSGFKINCDKSELFLKLRTLLAINGIEFNQSDNKRRLKKKFMRVKKCTQQ